MRHVMWMSVLAEKGAPAFFFVLRISRRVSSSGVRSRALYLGEIIALSEGYLTVARRW